MKELHFVLAGTGVIAPAYVEALAAAEGVRLVSVVTRKEVLPEWGAGLEIAHSVREVKEPWDALIVALPNGLHHPIALEAAALGKHVLVEKVLDIAVDACDRMIAACRAEKVKLGVCYQRRLAPGNRRLKSWLNRGLLGKVIAVDLEARYYRPPSYYATADYRGGKAIDGGGPLIQQAAHDIDLLCWFFGRPEKLASTTGRFLHQIECEDYGAALMRYESGMIATLAASTCCPPGVPSRMTLCTDRGRLVVEGDEVVSCGIEGLPMDEALEPLEVGHLGIVNDFAAAIRGDREPLVNGESARMSVELIQRIYEAAF